MHACMQAKSKGCRGEPKEMAGRAVPEAVPLAHGIRRGSPCLLLSPRRRADGPASYEHGLFSQSVPVVAIMASLRFDAMNAPHAGHPELFPTIHNVRLVTFALPREMHKAVRCG